MRRQRLAPLLLFAASALASDRLFAATFPGHSEATFSKVLAASGDAELAHRGQYDVTVLLAVVRRALRAQIAHVPAVTRRSRAQVNNHDWPDQVAALLDRGSSVSELATGRRRSGRRRRSPESR